MTAAGTSTGETPAALAELVTQVSPNSHPQRNTRQPVRKTKKKKQQQPVNGKDENTNDQPSQSPSTSINDAQSPHLEQPPQRSEQSPTTATTTANGKCLMCVVTKYTN